MNLTQIIIESDSLVIILALSSGSLSGDMGPIIQSTLAMLESFCAWKVRRLKRDYNMSWLKLLETMGKFSHGLA